jgi:phasin protein
MTSIPTDASAPMFKMGKEQTDAMVSMQKELLDAYEQASRAWLARVKSEVDFWQDLASKLSTTKSAPEALEAYRAGATQRMQMAADDARRLMEDCQKITQKVTQSLSNGGRPFASS